MPPTTPITFNHYRVLQIIPATGWIAISVDDYADMEPTSTTDPIPLMCEDVLCWALKESWTSRFQDEGRPQKGTQTYQDVVPMAAHNPDGRVFLDEGENFLGTCLFVAYDVKYWQAVAAEKREGRRRIIAMRAQKAPLV